MVKDIQVESFDDMISRTFSYMQFLERSFLFRGMKAADRKKVAGILKVRKYDKNENLFTQGETGDSVVIIVQGVVAFIEVNPQTKKEKLLRKLSTFEVIGENCFVHSSHRFLANVRAFTDLIVLVLERDDFEKNRTARFLGPIQQRVLTARRSLIRDGIQKVPFMKGLDDDDLSAFELEDLPAGYIFCREGEIGDKFYILLSGQVVVTTLDEMDLHVEITRMEPKEFPVSFGEMALVTSEPRNATITTLKESTVFSIEKREFQKILKKNSAVQRSFDEVVEKSEIGNYFAKNVPIFSTMSQISQRLLGVVTFFKVFEPGEYIKKEGEESERNFYLIEDGGVDIIVGGKFVKQLFKGDYFGEVGLVSNRVSSATVRVSDDGPLRCLAVSKEDFNTILATETSFLAQMKIRIEGANLSLEDLLQHPKGREAFLEHCTLEFAQENIDFWQDVLAIESLEHRKIRKSVLRAMRIDPKEIKEKKRKMLESRVRKIFEKYLIPGAPEEVNISASIREKLVERYENGDFSYDMFREAKHSVYHLIESDSFQRFKKSDSFQKLIDVIGEYK